MNPIKRLTFRLVYNCMNAPVYRALLPGADHTISLCCDVLELVRPKLRGKDYPKRITIEYTENRGLALSHGMQFKGGKGDLDSSLASRFFPVTPIKGGTTNYYLVPGALLALMSTPVVYFKVSARMPYVKINQI